MSIALLSKPQAVHAAMQEYDHLGRGAFLEKYGFRPARSYFVVHEGRRYDSKAIVGAAVGKEHPDRGPLRPDEFAGGDATVRAKLEALGFKMVIADPEVTSITYADVEQLRLARASGKQYAALSSDERGAYERITATLKVLGRAVADRLGPGYTLKLTSGFAVQSGVRGAQPKDLWFGIFPTENAETFLGNPQLFLIVSGRGLEFGFAASTHPGDFSNTEIKQKVREAAPRIFSLLPHPSDPLPARLDKALSVGAGWSFRRKGRLDPGQTDFPDLKAWLAFMHSETGKREAGGTICRYVVGPEIDAVDLQAELLEAVEIFRPLMEGMRPDRQLDAPIPPTSSEIFSSAMRTALAELDRVRAGPYGRMEPMWTHMAEVVRSLQALDAIRARPHIKIDWSLGQGNWARVPWIALLNRNVTTSTETGLYCVFLIANDLSRVYLTLNQGVTALIKELGPREGARTLAERAVAYRTRAPELADNGFLLDNATELAADGRLAANYKQGTIAHAELLSDRLPSDVELEALLEPLLAVYDRLAQESAADHVLEPVEPMIEDVLPAYTIDDAMDGLFIERAEFQRILAAWRLKKNLVLQGPPGVGKSFIARRLAYALIGSKDQRRVEAVQFHQSYGYEDFVQGYRPDGSGGFARYDGTFYRFCQKAMANPTREYVFLIDEINRGNLSKILGELMLLIEHDKRSAEWAVQLAYGKEGEPRFYIPENVYIIGMMNTADRSLSLVDYALRRRFAFISLDPAFESGVFRAHLETYGVPVALVRRIVQRMGVLNQAIFSDQANLGRGYQIGHSFFVPDGPLTDAEEWYQRVVETEIRPILEEYWFDNPEKADHWRGELLADVA
jgi:MoxR-like ATPase